jgi:protein-S-isoprenylcysteine O-methyltransferase Ste14
VHVDRGTDPSNQLVRSGPYGWVRHPLYVGACLECLAVPLLFNSFWSLLFAAAVFCPLEILRARFEERFLFDAFGDSYRAYAREVPGFLPRLGRRGRSAA